MKQRMQPKKILFLVIFLILLIPIGVPCGAFARACAIPPSADGTAQRYTETEPLGITIIETILGKNLKIYYTVEYVTVRYGNLYLI